MAYNLYHLINQPKAAIEIISKVFLPLSLAIIMLGIRMILILYDFTGILKKPKDILMGLINQLVFYQLLVFH